MNDKNKLYLPYAFDTTLLEDSPLRKAGETCTLSFPRGQRQTLVIDINDSDEDILKQVSEKLEKWDWTIEDIEVMMHSDETVQIGANVRYNGGYLEQIFLVFRNSHNPANDKYPSL